MVLIKLFNFSGGGFIYCFVGNFSVDWEINLFIGLIGFIDRKKIGIWEYGCYIDLIVYIKNFGENQGFERVLVFFWLLCYGVSVYCIF